MTSNQFSVGIATAKMGNCSWSWRTFFLVRFKHGIHIYKHILDPQIKFKKLSKKLKTINRHNVITNVMNTNHDTE
uniref:Uncharacterized protein n=1 Tax=Anguilla anguilla TaxID=7936 RepID=A0A0E9WEZ1_ANGAN